MLEPRRRVAERGQADARNRRVLRAVRDLIGAPGLEAAGHRHDGALQLETPARDFLRLAEGAVANRQRRVAAVSHDGIPDEIGDRRVRASIVRRELGASRDGDACRTRHVDPHQVVAALDVELPPDPDERVAQARQEAVAEIRFSGGVERAAAAVTVERHLPAAVDDVDERDAVRTARVARLEDVEVGRELDLARGVARRLVEPDDDLVAGVFRVDREVDRPDDLLVARRSDVGALGDVDARHFGGRLDGKQGDDRGGQSASDHARQYSILGL